MRSEQLRGSSDLWALVSAVSSAADPEDALADQLRRLGDEGARRVLAEAESLIDALLTADHVAALYPGVPAGLMRGSDSARAIAASVLALGKDAFRRMQDDPARLAEVEEPSAAGDAFLDAILAFSAPDEGAGTPCAEVDREDGSARWLVLQSYATFGVKEKIEGHFRALDARLNSTKRLREWWAASALPALAFEFSVFDPRDGTGRHSDTEKRDEAGRLRIVRSVDVAVFRDRPEHEYGALALRLVAELLNEVTARHGAGPPPPLASKRATRLGS